MGTRLCGTCPQVPTTGHERRTHGEHDSSKASRVLPTLVFISRCGVCRQSCPGQIGADAEAARARTPGPKWDAGAGNGMPAWGGHPGKPLDAPPLSRVYARVCSAGTEHPHTRVPRAPVPQGDEGLRNRVRAYTARCIHPEDGLNMGSCVGVPRGPPL